MNLIIINGLPATGKSTIANALSERLIIPMITKDNIKEFLFDTMGTKDREWSRQLGMVSSDFLYILADTLLADGQSVIIESSFEKHFATPQIMRLISKHSPDVIEIYCMTEKETRRKRFIERNETGARHVGHMDHINYLDDNDNEPFDKFAPLELTVGKFIKIDTTANDIVYIDNIIKVIRS